MRPRYDFSNGMPNNYAKRYAQEFTINIREKRRKTVRIVKTAEDIQREAEEFARRRKLPRRQTMLIVKSPDPAGTRDVCLRDMSLREIAEDSKRENVAAIPKPRARKKSSKKRG